MERVLSAARQEGGAGAGMMALGLPELKRLAAVLVPELVKAIDREQAAVRAGKPLEAPTGRGFGHGSSTPPRVGMPLLEQWVRGACAWCEATCWLAISERFPRRCMDCKAVLAWEGHLRFPQQRAAADPAQAPVASLVPRRFRRPHAPRILLPIKRRKTGCAAV